MPLIPKKPAVGDPVWWAPKQVGCQVTRVYGDKLGRIQFQGGPIIKNSRGHQFPKYCVETKGGGVTWNVHLEMWMVGRGPRPRRQGGIILLPEPCLITGKGHGSFATSGR
jgi:hypothetical protein